MIRTVIKPENQKITIDVPPNFVGKNVEVIAFAVEEIDSHPVTNDLVVTHLATEKVLAKDWLSPEEDLAWQDL